jgi:hypothetical protein
MKENKLQLIKYWQFLLCCILYSMKVEFGFKKKTSARYDHLK